MSDEAAIAARIADALSGAATREAGAGAALVSLEIAVVAAATPETVETRIVRKTRTLLFLAADARSSRGELTATASSVHKIIS
ncbi:MAG: hypothetical protein R3C25_04040 [Hyphomonadaceae bacterium]